jgi:hypothetical protein
MRSKKEWNKREKKVMSNIKVKRQPMSGANWLFKEDGESEDFLVQLKSTEKGSITVQLQDVLTLFEHAFTSKKIPLFLLDFIDKETKDEDLLICIRKRDLEKVLKIAQEKDVL